MYACESLQERNEVNSNFYINAAADNLKMSKTYSNKYDSKFCNISDTCNIQTCLMFFLISSQNLSYVTKTRECIHIKSLKLTRTFQNFYIIFRNWIFKSDYFVTVVVEIQSINISSHGSLRQHFWIDPGSRDWDKFIIRYLFLDFSTWIGCLKKKLFYLKGQQGRKNKIIDIWIYDFI